MRSSRRRQTSGIDRARIVGQSGEALSRLTNVDSATDRIRCVESINTWANEPHGDLRILQWKARKQAYFFIYRRLKNATRGRTPNVGPLTIEARFETN